jgi:hypothetical protein
MENHDTPAARAMIVLILEHGFKASGKVAYARGERRAVVGAKRTVFYTLHEGEQSDFRHYETETDVELIKREELEEAEVDPFAEEHEGAA